MLSELVNYLVADLGLQLASAAKSSWDSYRSDSSKIDRVRGAREIPISGLASIVSELSSSLSKETVVIRGSVQPLPVSLYTPRNYTRESSPLPPNFVVASHGLGEKRAVLQRITEFSTLDDDESSWPTSLKNLPFVVVPSGTGGNGNVSSDFVIINEDTFSHPLPLKTVYHRILESAESSPRHGDIHSEEVLKVGEEISVIGRLCSLEDGSYQIKPCEDLPYFLTEKTKPEMLRGLVKEKTSKFCFVIVCGVLSFFFFTYAFRRISRYWKGWRRFKELESVVASEEDNEEANGQECVICFTRSKTFVFVPCGHLLCCGPCALNVIRDLSQTCPLCRLPIRDIIKMHV